VKLSGDEWQAAYGGTVASAAAADDGSAEAPTPDATTAGKVDLAGQEGSSRDVHTPRFVIGALLSKYPELFSAIVSDMGLLRAAEVKAMNTVGEHFKQHAMQIFSDWKLTVRGYQRFVNLLSNYLDPEVEDLVPLVMPNGGSMAKLPSKRWLFEQIEEEMRRLGLQMTDDKLASIVDVESALHYRVRLLSSHGLIDHATIKLRVQLIIDVGGISPTAYNNGAMANYAM
jgi:hypothetical protein